MAKFHVTDTFTLESRQLFILAGSITEGEIRIGMTVRASRGPSGSVTARLHAIEFVRRVSRPDATCLCIRYTDPAELELWRSLDLGDEVIEVTYDPPAATE